MKTEKNLKALNFLLIEDDDLIRKAMKLYFKGKTKTFLAVENAELALKHVVKSPWDVIICDFKLPGMNGMEFFKNLSSKEKETVKILITGYAVPEMGKKRSESLVHDTIVKPFTMKEITTSLTRVLRKRSKKKYRNMIQSL